MPAEDLVGDKFSGELSAIMVVAGHSRYEPDCHALGDNFPVCFAIATDVSCDTHDASRRHRFLAVFGCWLHTKFRIVLDNGLDTFAFDIQL
jgi:hypothetical protein